MGGRWKRDPYLPTVYRVGYHGEGEFIPSVRGVHTQASRLWKGMLKRCYDEGYSLRKPTYKDCKVCKEWHNFQNFAKWHRENYYEIDGQEMHLDKDILCKGNKIYSPETCVFVPECINSLFTKRQSCRGELPIGVHFCKRRNKYISQCGSNGKRIYLGGFDSPEEAFLVYKDFKEKEIKRVADLYKDKIPSNLYEALYNYKVEIAD